jgi:hypothetical protein
MTQQPLRLIVDRHDQSTTDSIEVQSTVAAGIHIHLHLGGVAPIATPPAAISAADAEGRSGKGRRRPWLIAVCGLAIATGAFEFGARSGEGHARSAAAIANAGNLAATMSGPPAGGAPGDLPPSVRQLLAQPPTITPSAASAAGSSPFGLHP